MQAAYARGFGGETPLSNLAVGDLPAPDLGPGQARVRLTAAALNHHDLWTLQGVSSRPLVAPQILGCDGTGVVDEYAAGAGAQSPPPGSRVVLHAVVACGNCSACRRGDEAGCTAVSLLSEPPHGGTLAQWIVVPTSNLVPLPDAVDDLTAACLPVAYLTAYRMLFECGGLSPGDSVLVHGATGGVATAAMMLARGAGITVYATARTEEKRAFALAQGAAAAFDPADRNTFKAILSVTDGGVTAVIDTVGEPTWELSLRAVRPGGRVVVAGATGGANPPAQLNRIFWRRISIVGTSMGTRDELSQLVEMCARGALSPLVDSVTALDDVAGAFARLSGGAQRGKLVVTI